MVVVVVYCNYSQLLVQTLLLKIEVEFKLTV